MVHGALGSAGQLAPLRQAFGTRPVTILELDGHGETPAAGDRYDLTRFADQIERAVTEPTLVVGYSLGGYAALLLASRGTPNLAGVVTLGTKLAWTPELAAREVGRLDPVTIRAKVPRFAHDLEVRHRGAGGWEAVLAKTARMMTELGVRPIVDDALLASIDLPVRLMVGDRDGLVSIDETTAAYRKLRHGQLAVLPNTPHPIEQVRAGDVLAQVVGLSNDIDG